MTRSPTFPKQEKIAGEKCKTVTKYNGLPIESPRLVVQLVESNFLMGRLLDSVLVTCSVFLPIQLLFDGSKNLPRSTTGLGPFTNVKISDVRSLLS